MWDVFFIPLAFILIVSATGVGLVTTLLAGWLMNQLFTGLFWLLNVSTPKSKV